MTIYYVLLNYSALFLLLPDFDEEFNQSLEPKLELLDMKEDLHDLYKEGMIWTKEDGPAPDGFTLYTMENGTTVLRRKRQRNLQKLGKALVKSKSPCSVTVLVKRKWPSVQFYRKQNGRQFKTTVKIKFQHFLSKQ